MYTYFGDANLDGTVNADDYAAIDASVVGTNGLYQGDFNYDGIISGDDVAIIDYDMARQS
jgi:hypothetical protein